MSNYTTGLAPKPDGTQAVIDTAIRATAPHELHPGGYYAIQTPDGRLHQIDLTGDQHLDTPARKKGTVTVTDLPSFVHYWGKHHDGASEIYVNPDDMRITAILDAHTEDTWEDGARWGQHRLILQAKPTPEWLDWTGLDRRELSQRQWAEFIEEHAASFVEPDAATMLEIAQTFQAHTRIKFSSTTILQNGDRRLSWDETTDASGGKAGDTVVPAEFQLGLQPFDWTTERFPVSARFRYRVEQGSLKVQFLLTEPEKVIKEAMADLVLELEAALNGTAEEPKSGDALDRPWKVMTGSPISSRG